MADGEKQPLNKHPQEREQSCFLRHVGLVPRLWGLVTLAVIWAATVTLLQGKYKDAPQYAPYYLLAVGIVVTFFEATWILDKLACCVRQGCCCKCWAAILWVDKWRKFVLYIVLTVPLFLQGIRVILGVISGFCLLLLACLYLVKSFSTMLLARDRPAEVTSTAPGTVIRHEMSTQTEKPSTNPFEEKEWSEEETPQQQRQRQQRQKQQQQNKQQQQQQQREEQSKQQQQQHHHHQQQQQQQQQEEQSEPNQTPKEGTTEEPEQNQTNE